jgi:hypothetical protein
VAKTGSVPLSLSVTERESGGKIIKSERKLMIASFNDAFTAAYDTLHSVERRSRMMNQEGGRRKRPWDI